MNLASGEKPVWCEVEIFEYATEVRPESQGGMWYLAKWMKVVRELSTEDVAEITAEILDWSEERKIKEINNFKESVKYYYNLNNKFIYKSREENVNT